MIKILLLLVFVALAYSTLTPAHVQLTLNGDITTLQVTFSTSTKPTKPSITFWLSTAPTQKVTTVANPADIHTFTHPSTTTVEYITTITMTPLARASKYSYFASGTTNDTTTNSATYTFYTIPADTSALNIGIYGDMGAYGTGIIEKGEGGLNYWAQNHKFDFIIHNGDLAYNLDSNSGDTGTTFLTNLESVSAIMPYVVTPGNHEFMGTSETYYDNWFLGQTLLGKNSNSTDPIQHYSFDVGTKLHVVGISSEVYCEDKNNIVGQWNWLKNDLAAVRKRTVQPWIFVLGHRQIYIGTESTFHSRLMRFGLQCNDSSLQHCDYTPCKSGKNCGYSIEKLLNDYHVDIYFAGHVHTYNRMYPITPDMTYETQDETTYLNPQHPVYVVSGAAGTESSPPTAVHAKDPFASPTVKSVSGYSFSLVTVYNSTHLRLVQNDITTAKIADDFWIEKDSKKAPWSKTAALTIDTDTALICDQ